MFSDRMSALAVWCHLLLWYSCGILWDRVKTGCPTWAVWCCHFPLWCSRGMFSAREKTGYINSIIKDRGLCDVTLAEVKGQLKGRWQLSWAENVEDNYANVFRCTIWFYEYLNKRSTLFCFRPSFSGLNEEWKMLARAIAILFPHICQPCLWRHWYRPVGTEC